ncbi:MAG: DNA/RNA non-specific endonuclease [Mycoplasmatales bacterium]
MRKLILTIVLCLITFTGCAVDTTTQEVENKYISVDKCNLSGHRKANVIVDVGVDTETINREYYAYTNEYGQVIKLEADRLILQTKEEENKKGRYCNDEAKVKGTEDSNLDEGHIIADSLGGSSNAYNITPQDSYLNRNGEQRTMENHISNALKHGSEVTNYIATITYDTAITLTPKSYKYTFKINGEDVIYEFENK